VRDASVGSSSEDLHPAAPLGLWLVQQFALAADSTQLLSKSTELNDTPERERGANDIHK
jgi:hypothetical protein